MTEMTEMNGANVARPSVLACNAKVKVVHTLGSAKIKRNYFFHRLRCCNTETDNNTWASCTSIIATSIDTATRNRKNNSCVQVALSTLSCETKKNALMTKYTFAMVRSTKIAIIATSPLEFANEASVFILKGPPPFSPKQKNQCLFEQNTHERHSLGLSTHFQQ